MILVFSVLLIILACLIIPTALDHIKNYGNIVHWTRRMAAYGVMTFFSMAFPLFIGQIHFDIISAFLAVAIAVMITEVSIAGTTIVLSLTTVVFPVTVLYALGIVAKINDPFAAILNKMEWQFLFLPFFTGIIGLFITRIMIKKWNFKKA
jgi:hypothetical protein